MRKGEGGKEGEGEKEREREAKSLTEFYQLLFLRCGFAGDITGIELTSSLYPSGDYVLTITAIDVEEQTTTVQVNLTIQSNHTILNCCQI